MKCVLCYMISKGAKSLEIPYDCKDAITVVNGYATCDDHFPDVQHIHYSSLTKAFHSAWDSFQIDAGLSTDRYSNTWPYRDGRNPE